MQTITLGQLVAAVNGRLPGTYDNVNTPIDVLDTEPMRPSHPYLTAKNCYITPHVAWGTLDARSRLITMVAENLKAYEAGKPINKVN